jgi:hypothetical protein
MVMAVSWIIVTSPKVFWTLLPLIPWRVFGTGMAGGHLVRGPYSSPHERWGRLKTGDGRLKRQRW